MRVCNRIHPGNCLFCGEKAVQFLLDASVGIEFVKYKMLQDLTLPRYVLKLYALCLFCRVVFASSLSAFNLHCSNHADFAICLPTLKIEFHAYNRLHILYFLKLLSMCQLQMSAVGH